MYRYWKRLFFIQGLGTRQSEECSYSNYSQLHHDPAYTEEDTELQLISPLNIGQSSEVADMSRASSSSCQWFILVRQRLKGCIQS